MPHPQVVDAESFSAVARVSRETMARFHLYESLIRKWQQTMNLVSEESLGAIWGRHMWDSAQLAFIAPPKSKIWLDLGSGAGFPGIVIALLGAADQDVHLIESDRRKCAFLNEVIRQTKASAQVHMGRIESYHDRPQDIAEGVEVITARACAPLNRLFSYAYPFWGSHTVGLFLKGRNVEDELTDASECWNIDYEKVSSRAHSEGVILKVNALKPRGS